jgi:hypothetical protein
LVIDSVAVHNYISLCPSWARWDSHENKLRISNIIPLRVTTGSWTKSNLQKENSRPLGGNNAIPNSKATCYTRKNIS